jgi:hypothetical protein
MVGRSTKPTRLPDRFRLLAPSICFTQLTVLIAPSLTQAVP